ncbi:MAG: GvpL/GvpF family gas vesicle protein [bacterium]
MMIYSIISLNKNPEKLKAYLQGMKGILNTDLYAVFYNEIAVVVSDLKRANLVSDSVNALAYGDVIEKLAKQFTLLPMRFGSVLESRELIISMLEKNYYGIINNLQKVDNKFEFGLKVFCDTEKVLAELKIKLESDDKTETKSLKETQNSVYRDWVEKKLKEHRREEQLLSYVNTIIEDITNNLEKLDSVSKFKKMVTETTIIDALFLLDKPKKEDLVQTIGDMKIKYPGLNFVLTGPWSPYNFVDITIKE